MQSPLIALLAVGALACSPRPQNVAVPPQPGVSVVLVAEPPRAAEPGDPDIACQSDADCGAAARCVSYIIAACEVCDGGTLGTRCVP